MNLFEVAEGTVMEPSGLDECIGSCSRPSRLLLLVGCRNQARHRSGCSYGPDLLNRNTTPGSLRGPL